MEQSKESCHNQGPNIRQKEVHCRETGCRPGAPCTNRVMRSSAIKNGLVAGHIQEHHVWPAVWLESATWEGAHDEGQSLLSADGDAGGDPLVTPDPKGTHCVSGLAEDRLASQLLQDLHPCAALSFPDPRSTDSSAGGSLGTPLKPPTSCGWSH